MTAAALKVRFASGSSRSMRAATVACRVAGTFTSATLRPICIRPLSAQYTTLGQVAHDLLGEERITGGPVGDSGPMRQPRGPPRAAPKQRCRLRITQRHKG